jgi:phosphatidylglycerol---prolipoprotein diacylglyceryl transferase
VEIFEVQMRTAWRTSKFWLPSSERAASKENCTVAADTEEGKRPFLDAIVIHANKLTLFRLHYKPYWIMSDAAALSALAYAWAFSRRFPTVSGLGLTVAVLAALFVYKIGLEAKAALGKTAARSFLQDCLLFIIPSFLIVSLLFKQPLSLAFAFFGTLMPLYGCLARVGCFLGGCCFGKPSPSGVLYPRTIFESAGHGCRRFSASPNPGTRVFPVQLVEAGAQATLFAILATAVWQIPGTAGYIFWMYLSLYAVVRFILDFYRTTSARPRHYGFSEAQLVCVGVQAVSLTILACL